MGTFNNLLLYLSDSLLQVDKHANAAEVFDQSRLLNQLNLIVFQMDISGTLVHSSPSWTKLLGFSQTEAIGKRLLDYIHPKDRAKVEDYLHRIYRSESECSHSIICRFINKLNNSIFTIFQASAIRENLDSNRIKGIVGVLTEITQRIQQQEIIEAKYRSLQHFVNNCSGMLYRCRNDENLTFEYTSKGCFELTGFEREKFIEGNKINYLNLIHPDDSQRIMETIQRKLHADKAFEIPHRILAADGTQRWVFNKGKGNFSSSGELLSFEGMLFDFDKQKLIQERNQQKVLYDSDTKLLNKILFVNRLEHAVEKIKQSNDYAYTFLCLHIDQYSQLLANLGTQSVQSVMIEIGHRIDESLNQPVSLCRLQEDLFGILLDSPQNDIKNVTKVINQIQEQVQAPLTIGDNEVYVTVSIGVVIGNKKYEDGDAVLIEAQNALSRAMNLGGARYEVSDLVTHGKAALQTHMEFELEKALEKHEFLVHWQPIVSSKDNSLVGLEARLAWPHPLHGMLYAEQFVPNAEDTQLITPLWEWMLNDAQRQIEVWKADISNIENVSLNILVTGASLLDADSIIRLREKLLSVKPKLCNLIVGVTENVLDHAPRIIRSLLKPMEGNDIQLLLDSYGSSKTALSILQNMPIDLIRLDSGLIEHLSAKGEQFINAITSFAHSLDIDVIAYGVKNADQLKLLKNIEVDYIQGDYITKPIDEMEVKQLLLHTSSDNLRFYTVD